MRDAAVRGVGASCLVLTYHRVAELATDPQLLAVRPDTFRAQVEILARRYRVVALPRLLADLREHALEPGSIALTFDDGYADNPTAAAPVLVAAGLPATVFVSSGCVERGREFWWDEVGRLVLDAPELPQQVDLEVPDGSFAASVGPSEGPADPHWDVLQPDSHPSHRLYREVSSFLRPLPAAQREDALDQLARAVGLARGVREAYRPMSPAEVAELDTLPGLEIGAHSRDHDVLALRTPEEQTAAVLDDKAALGALCGRTIETFSYPFGGRADFSTTTARIVEDAGFAGACANHPGLVKPWTDRFRLPRQVVRDWDAETLRRRIDEWLGTPGAETDPA